MNTILLCCGLLRSMHAGHNIVPLYASLAMSGSHQADTPLCGYVVRFVRVRTLCLLRSQQNIPL